MAREVKAMMDILRRRVEAFGEEAEEGATERREEGGDIGARGMAVSEEEGGLTERREEKEEEAAEEEEEEGLFKANAVN